MGTAIVAARRCGGCRGRLATPLKSGDTGRWMMENCGKPMVPPVAAKRYRRLGALAARWRAVERLERFRREHRLTAYAANAEGRRSRRGAWAAVAGS